MNLAGADGGELPQHVGQFVLGAGEAGVRSHRVDELTRDPIHIVPQVAVNLGAGVGRVAEGEPERGGQMGGRLAGLRPGGAADLEQLVLFGDVEVQRDAGQAVGPRRGAAQRLGPDGADQQSRSALVDRGWADRNNGFGDLLPLPHPFHDVHPLCHLAHGLRRRVRADGQVVLVPTAHPDADGEPAAAEHIAGGQRFGQQHRVVQLGHHHRGDQRDPLRPGRQGPEECQRLGIAEGDALAPAQ